jgi:DNA-binding CsgD family transcriptional regulator
VELQKRLFNQPTLNLCIVNDVPNTMSVVEIHAIPLSGHPSEVAGLVGAIGTDEFGIRLVQYLNTICGADHCAVFQLSGDSLSTLTIGSVDRSLVTKPMVERYVGEGLWREDPAMTEVRSHIASAFPSLIRANLEDDSYCHLRPRVYPRVRDRLVVCGRRGSLQLGLSVLRNSANEKFGSGAIERLAETSEMLLSALAKHANFLTGRADPGSALDNLVEISRCLVSRSYLPRREVEVCSRILYGMSTLGIALDIGIGEESVRTYRKRAYQRLQIGSERELIRWYLHEWSLWTTELH